MNRETPRASFLGLALAWLLAVNMRVPLIAIGPLLPLIITDLNLSATMAGAMSALPFFVVALVSIPGGLLCDALGIRRVALGGLLAVSIFGACRGITSTTPGLLAMLVGLGAAVGFVQPALGKMAQASSAGATVTTAVYTNGLNMGVLAASALSVPVVLPLVGAHSWRGVFVVWGIFGLITLLLWWMLIPRVPLRTSVPGAGNHGASASRGGRLLLALVLIYAAQGAAFNGLLTWLPGYLVTRGFDLVRGSVALSAMSLGTMIAAFAVPKLAGSPRHRARPFYLSSLLVASGHVALLARPELATLWTGIAGFGIGLSFTYGLALPAELAPPEGTGAMVGAVLSLGAAGAFLAPMAMGLLRDFSGSLAPGFVLLAAVGVVPALASRLFLGGLAGGSRRRAESGDVVVLDDLTLESRTERSTQ